ncbi:MAG: 2Fe-2S iron-sulfur cluster-binding protein [Alphaproteobacteria bacterium]|jgi:fumarate reductase iron-sulfur subunit|nr:2Fe-2S iron-sulfur cluster-binding protein [Alphaproteobacteria bacterium]MDP6563242.1 2Fe-2S iron-sulfur cluster-binding protein [Alphaproteobacteria bacterium]MDP6814890.1 2Fe-2S iron-sulfur cluster-binding protein [Alphaproteobacteria bacterium]
MTRDGDDLRVRVWRGGTDGAFQDFRVPHRPDQTVLDVVTWIQRHLAPGLAYRFACRVGMCGSCAMTVNGRPRWTCRSHVADVANGGRLDIEPLANLPIIRDLVADLTPFFEKWQGARGRFVPSAGRGDPTAAIAPSEPRRRQADLAVECINCAVCYAACDVVAWNGDYLGPAALNRAWVAFNDRRDGAPEELLRAVAGDAGCHGCHSQQSCSRHCPNELDPSRSIAGLKRAGLPAWLRGGDGL